MMLAAANSFKNNLIRRGGGASRGLIPSYHLSALYNFLFKSTTYGQFRLIPPAVIPHHNNMVRKILYPLALTGTWTSITATIGMIRCGRHCLWEELANGLLVGFIAFCWAHHVSRLDQNRSRMVIAIHHEVNNALQVLMNRKLLPELQREKIMDAAVNRIYLAVREHTGVIPVTYLKAARSGR